MNNDSELESLAQQAQQITRQYFGRSVGLYAPLYLSNFCENKCLYCGFNTGVKIERKKLSPADIEAECSVLAGTGIQNILLLTGESRGQTPVSYLKEAVSIIKKYFPYIALEVYPLETNEYQELFEAGVDGVTIYQETYDRKLYDQIHVSGKKKDYNYRYEAPERVARSGIRNLSMGVLLGLGDWQYDVNCLFDHLDYMIKNYPGIEYGLSFPRMQNWEGSSFEVHPVSDADMLRIIAMARLRFPRVDITLSTRESATFRDSILPVGITKLSAGSLTSVGGYVDRQKKSAPQFEINDDRSLEEIKTMLKSKDFDPVLTSWRSIKNG